jgi:CheY-like chemotaxis protein
VVRANNHVNESVQVGYAAVSHRSPRSCTGNLIVRVTLRECSRWKQKEEIVKVRGDHLEKVLRIGTVMVSVIDDGVGMTSEQVSQVFNDGTQFNANLLQAGGGSGLGLSIARGLVIQHGGELSCSSDGLGKGTTFTVSLPVYEEIETIYPENESMRVEVSDQSVVADESLRDKPTLSTLPEKVREESSDFVIPPLRILVVDDALTNRKLCMRILDRSGHTTEGACDGNEAVEKVRKSLENGDLYDCILLDYEMPVMRGPAACELMRKIGCSSFIVGVTGNVMSEDVDHFRKCGANWVLPKPFRLEALEQLWIELGVVPCAKAGSEVTEVSTVMVDTVEDADVVLSYRSSVASTK